MLRINKIEPVVRLVILCVSLIFISLIFTGLSSAKINKKSIVGIWLFDEGENDVVLDYSENGNDGEVKGQPEWVEGKFGLALSCNPDNYVEVSDSPSLDLTSEITVMAWVNVESYHSGEIVMKSRELSADITIYGFQVWHDKRVLCHVITDTGWKEIGGQPYPLDEWFHLAMTYEGNDLKWYLDGSLLTESPKSGEIETNDDPFMIGGGHHFNGLIDEVALFNVALSDSDIQSIMTKGLDKAIGITAVSPKDKLATVWATIKIQ